MHMVSGELWALADYRVYLAANNSQKHPATSSFSESHLGKPTEQFAFEGKKYSRSSLNYLNGLSFLKQHLDTSSINSVLEIGWGFGTLDEILSFSDGVSYINVDIPPTSTVSTYYLSQISGIDLIDYSRTRELQQIKIPVSNAQMVLCPWQLPKLRGKLDLFVNFISFQEMEPDIVKLYLEQVDRLETEFVLLRNIKEGKAVKSEKVVYGVETPIRGSDYDDFLVNYSLVAKNVFPFGYKTMYRFHSELRLYKRNH